MQSKPYAFARPFDTAIAAEKALRSRPASIWQRRGEKAALALFQDMAERVPAYKDFLKKNKIRAASIETAADFAQLPTVDKNNYLRAYPLAALSWDGELSDTYAVYASTSGSTGTPFYFPRAEKQTEQYALLAELYLRSQFKIHERKTLYVNCFAMGAWIGGLFTFQAIERLAASGAYPLHIITPGLAAQEALKAIRTLGPNYEQVIIGGYPPYVKDLIDQGVAADMRWEQYNVKFVFSAEGFSEKFRDRIAQAAGQKNVLRDSLNHYGTVDLGTMAYETPFAAYIRRAALQKPEFFKDFFGQVDRLPTLAQYLPEHFYFENRQGGLIASADAGLPLVRYDLKDHGGLWDFDSAIDRLTETKPAFFDELKNAGISDTMFNLPFVYLYERADFSVVLYGANVYPEHIRSALESESCSRFATGKCAVRIAETRSLNPRLEVHIELKKGVLPSVGFKKITEQEVLVSLVDHNSEYANTKKAIGKKAHPHIQFWPYGDSKYFSGTGKQKWSHK